MSSDVAELEQAVDGVPDSWRLFRLGDVADISRGTSWGSDNERRDPVDGALPVLGIRNVQARLEIDDLLWLHGLKPSAIASSTVQTGDILMVGSNGNPARIGNAVQVDEPGRYLYASLLFGLRPRREVVDPDFLYFAVVAPGLQTAISDAVQGTTGLSNLKITTLRDLPIDLPPLDEQRRIAEVLKSVDEALTRSKVAVGQASRAIEGMLQRLFVEGIGHSVFKEGRSTPIPVSWDEKSLGELSATPVTYGVVQPGPNVADGIPFVRGGDFPNGTIDIGSLRKIGADVASQYRRTQLKGGEIVVSLVGYPGACAIVPEELAGANVARQAALIRPSKEVAASYLYQFLRSPIGQGRLKKETIGSAQQVINLRDLKEVIVALPPKQEQEEIAAILADLDAFVGLETANLDKLTVLKGSIAADLLAGRVRVPA